MLVLVLTWINEFFGLWWGLNIVQRFVQIIIFLGGVKMERKNSDYGEFFFFLVIVDFSLS